MDSKRIRSTATQPRAAFTLVELVVVLTMLGIVTTIGVRMLGVMLEADARSSVDVMHQLTRERLTSRFRSDVSTAQSHTLVDESTLKLEFPSASSVTYQSNERGILRTVTQPEKPVVVDQFLMSNVRCLIKESPRLLTLIVTGKQASAERPERMDMMRDSQPRAFQIDAATSTAHMIDQSDEEESDAN